MKQKKVLSKMDALGKLIRDEAAYCANIEQGLDCKPSEYIAQRLFITQKTAIRKIQNGGWTYDEIKLAVSALRHRDGSNPLLDRVVRDLGEQ